MINIDFEIDLNELAIYKSYPINKIEGSLITTTVLAMQLRFQIDSLELFDVEGDPWSPGPIMSLATEVS